MFMLHICIWYLADDVVEVANLTWLEDSRDMTWFIIFAIMVEYDMNPRKDKIMNLNKMKLDK